MSSLLEQVQLTGAGLGVLTLKGVFLDNFMLLCSVPVTGYTGFGYFSTLDTTFRYDYDTLCTGKYYE